MKIDLKKQMKAFYAASAKSPVFVEIPAMSFLMVDGSGDPNTSGQYSDAVQALFAMSYAAKFHVKKTTGTDYGVMPLEGLWWADDMSAFSTQDRTGWQWRMMMMQPQWVDDDVIRLAREKAEQKLSRPLGSVRHETLTEGTCAQIMHVGPYAQEAPTIATLHRFVAEGGKTLRGKHHEIYLGDPRRTKPERLKTILRQPVA